MNDFVVFILSYQRCGNIKTLKSLERGGYTGPVYIVCGNDDPTLEEYKAEYGDHLLIFDKDEYMKSVDTIDNVGKDKCILYARLASFDLAKDLGIDYFIELDDDYVDFEEREISGNKLLTRRIRDLDMAFELTFDFLRESGADVVAWAQGGDFIGGARNKRLRQKILRKAMNTFFCRADRPLDFIGSVNEDVNFYVNGNMRGEKIFTVTDADIVQTATQSNAGGMTDLYMDEGTWQKSFYSVVCQPSCVSIMPMGDKHKRIHHRVDWNYCAPMILNEKYKKGDRDGETV